MSNEEVVRKFIAAIINEKKPQLAFELYVGDEYIQHNPRIRDGVSGAVDFLSNFLNALPNVRTDIRRTISEGNFVVVHQHLTWDGSESGLAAIDIFRFVNGKIIEHWDVIQEIPKVSLNSNSMF